MTTSEELTVARALREALGYESREVRIDNLKRSRYIDVRQLMARLEAQGLVTENSIKEVLMADQFRAAGMLRANLRPDERP